MLAVRTFMIFCVILCVISCKNVAHKNMPVDNFYTEKGEWDSARIPVLKPYEAILLNKETGWFMNLKGDNGDSGFNNIKKITVTNDIILVYSVNSIFNGVEVKETWRIIVPKNGIETAFDKHEDYLSYLNKLGFTSEPHLAEVEKVADYFDRYDVIDWKVVN